MKKHHVWPEGHWNWPIPVTHKHGVRCGQMLFVGGQVDLTPQGAVCNPGDLHAQIPNAMAAFGRVLGDLGAGLPDLVKLLCFYVNDGSVDEAGFLDVVAACLPAETKCAVTAVPVPYLAYPGMAVEIEGIAMRAENGEALSRIHVDGAPGLAHLPGRFVHALQCAKMIFVSGQSPVTDAGEVLFAGDIVTQTKQVMKQHATLLGALGADLDDAVKLNRWYVGHGTEADFEPAALACGVHFAEPGPCGTGIPLPCHAVPGQQIKIELICMRGEDGERLARRHVWPDSLWDWTIDLPYKHGLKCHDMIFLGGQVSLDKQGRAIAPNELAAQTRTAMANIGTILRELGADYADVCKVIAFYEGECGEDTLHENFAIRSACFAEPGPATTGLPFPRLAYPGMVIEIAVIAMTEPDKG
jgi:enamine deaminase RidA (YjgF/YER057c/UK114 family)